MSITVITDLQAAADEYAAGGTKSIADLVSENLNRRYPDSVRWSYIRMVRNEAGPTPFASSDNFLKNQTIAIVGAGAAGAAALFELAKIVTNTSNFQVHLYESDPLNYVHGGSEYDRRMGRVYTNKSNNSKYELGAMRYPSAAGLTWHYMSCVYPPSTKVDPFPNPGVVPTLFGFMSKLYMFLGDNWKDLQPYDSDGRVPPLEVRNLVLSKMLGTGGRESPQTYLTIGSKEPKDFANFLKDPASGDAAAWETAWGQFVRQWDGISLGTVVRKIIQDNVDLLPQLQKNTPQYLSKSELVDVYVEMFGRLGFGTGGFKPLFHLSVVEVMRLILWDYSAEYSPPNDSADLLNNMFNRAKGILGRRLTTFKNEVTDIVQYSDGLESRAAGVVYLDNGKSSVREYNAVILAVPHHVAARLCERVPTTGSGWQDLLLGDYAHPLEMYDHVMGGLTTFATNATYVPSWRNNLALTSCKALHMTRASKVFATIPVNRADQLLPTWDGTRKIRAQIWDSELAATYILPGYFDPKTYTILVSYTWEEDAAKYQSAMESLPFDQSRGFRDYIMNRANLGYGADRSGTAVAVGPYVAALLNDPACSPVETSWDWSTSYASGAFKLDHPGDHVHSDRLFKLHRLAIRHYEVGWDARGRVFLAGDSYSHLGGWLEGAFQSALNAVTGLVFRLNGDDSLNQAALDMMRTLGGNSTVEGEAPGVS